MIEINDKTADFMKFLGVQESQYIEPASRWTEDVIDEINGVSTLTGDPMPWIKTQNKVRFRPGEVSIWGGYNGHGKSQFLNQVCAWGLSQKKWLIASMEMPPRKTMRRMVAQVFCEELNEQRARDFMTWTDNRLWIYDQTDTIDSKRILGMIHYCFTELNIDHIIIDSLMKCGFKGSKDNVSSQQVEFVDRLCWAAKKHDKHIHLVHHMRKGDGLDSETKVPGKHDFRGAGEIVDLVDNAFIVHRNKDKEKRIEAGESVGSDIPDATLSVVKQRHGDWEGTFKFWFDKSSMQYQQSEGERLFHHG